MGGFREKLAALCAGEMVHARRDSNRAAEMIEGLGSSIGLTIAVISRGDGKAVDALSAGIDWYIQEEVSRQAGVSRLLKAIATPPKGEDT